MGLALLVQQNKTFEDDNLAIFQQSIYQEIICIIDND